VCGIIFNDKATCISDPPEHEKAKIIEKIKSMSNINRSSDDGSSFRKRSLASFRGNNGVIENKCGNVVLIIWSLSVIINFLRLLLGVETDN
jgi:hypothetical protein